MLVVWNIPMLLAWHQHDDLLCTPLLNPPWLSTALPSTSQPGFWGRMVSVQEGAVALLLLSRKTAYTNQSCWAHKFRGCLVFMEVDEGEFGSCQGSQLGLVSARPHLVKSKCLVTENKSHPLMPLTSCTKSLIACWYLGKSRYPFRCQFSCKIEIASFVTGSMPRNTSGSRVLAVFVLCSQQETICW